MVSVFTPNINLEEPGRGDQSGVWDTPVNSNMSVVDLVVGGGATQVLNNSPVVLSAAQYKSRLITLASTLTGSCLITFPSTFIKDYLIRNVCTGSSAFIVTLATTVAGGQVIAAPPGETVSIYNDGTNLIYSDLGRVGSYLDYAGSSMPAWVDACTIKPYLACNSTTFSATLYPNLALLLGSTTTPDMRGKARITLDQGAAILSSAVTGFSPNTVGASGGQPSITIGSSNLPASIPYKDNGHSHTYVKRTGANVGGGGAFGPVDTATNTQTSTDTIGITINPSTAAAGTGNAFATMQPSIMGGITMIRAG